MKTRETSFGAAFLSLAFAVAQPLNAQTISPADQARLDEIEIQKKLLTAELELQTAKENLAAAKRTSITALGLPSFNGDVQLQNDAGKMEVGMLSALAVRGAASKIQQVVERHCIVPKPAVAAAPAQPAVSATAATPAIPAKPAVAAKPAVTGSNRMLILGGTEELALADAASVGIALDVLVRSFASAGFSAPAPNSFNASLAGDVAAANAIFGLIRSDRTYSSISATEIDDEVLARAIAGELTGCAVRPNSRIGSATTKSNLLLGKHSAIQSARVAAQTKLLLLQSKDPKTLTLSEKQEIAAIKSVVADYQAFAKIWLSSDANGRIKLMSAVRAFSMLDDQPNVLRVTVDKVGGTSVITKNIGTYIGLNPLRLTGAAIVSYQLTEGSSGKVLASGILNCATVRMTMGGVHRLIKNQSRPAGTVGCSP